MKILAILILFYWLVQPSDQPILPGLNCTSGYFMDLLTNSCHLSTLAPENINSAKLCLSTTEKNSLTSTTFQKKTHEKEETGLTCGRNTRRDLETKSCIKCDPCTYVDHDLHSQQTCDVCSGGNTQSYLVYCPKKCLDEEYSVTKIGS